MSPGVLLKTGSPSMGIRQTSYKSNKNQNIFLKFFAFVYHVTCKFDKRNLTIAQMSLPVMAHFVRNLGDPQWLCLFSGASLGFQSTGSTIIRWGWNLAIFAYLLQWFQKIYGFHRPRRTRSNGAPGSDTLKRKKWWGSRPI